MQIRKATWYGETSRFTSVQTPSGASIPRRGTLGQQSVGGGIPETAHILYLWNMKYQNVYSMQYRMLKTSLTVIDVDRQRLRASTFVSIVSSTILIAFGLVLLLSLPQQIIHRSTVTVSIWHTGHFETRCTAPIKTGLRTQISTGDFGSQRSICRINKATHVGQSSWILGYTKLIACHSG